MQDIELAWAAGFFDGEGSISIHRKPSKRSGDVTPVVRVSLVQVDRRPLDRFVTALGGIGKVYGPYERNRGRTERPFFYWMTDRGRAIGVIGTLWPYLCEPKREQVLRAGLDLSERSITWRAA